ncbi:acyl-CoA thioesterase [uncultured Paraglaciecola sp.]|uniref:acyl-CoA thioesterase n=1 Tax=uncultured Paraglaciecola sp. TaxID=1765024 RepID=UPI0030D9B16F|tara:strand:- start:64317 stop:64760 length:444 start_codon:yes stop_codon:yes gene_type:complete
MSWLLPNPFLCQWQVMPEQIDHYQHANNVAYVSQLEVTSWKHSNHLGLTIEQYMALDRGMAISRHEINYLAAAHVNDLIDCATWIVECDNRLKLTRQFQFIRRSDQLTLLTARTEFVCIALSSGKPKRMPKEFANVYGANIQPTIQT